MWEASIVIPAGGSEKTGGREMTGVECCVIRGLV